MAPTRTETATGDSHATAVGTPGADGGAGNGGPERGFTGLGGLR